MQASHTVSYPLALSPTSGTCSPVAAPVSQMSLPPPACVSEEPKAWPIFVIMISEDPFFSLFGPLESLGCILLLSMAHCSALHSSVRSSSEPGTRCQGREQRWALPACSLQSLGKYTLIDEFLIKCLMATYVKRSERIEWITRRKNIAIGLL